MLISARPKFFKKVLTNYKTNVIIFIEKEKEILLMKHTYTLTIIFTDGSHTILTNKSYRTIVKKRDEIKATASVRSTRID